MCALSVCCEAVGGSPDIRHQWSTVLKLSLAAEKKEGLPSREWCVWGAWLFIWLCAPRFRKGADDDERIECVSMEFRLNPPPPPQRVARWALWISAWICPREHGAQVSLHVCRLIHPSVCHNVAREDVFRPLPLQSYLVSLQD